MRQRQFAKKLEARRQVLDELDRQQRAGSDRQETPRWIRHRWSEDKCQFVVDWFPGGMPRPSESWHRAGSSEEIAARPRKDPKAFERQLEARVRQGRE